MGDLKIEALANKCVSCSKLFKDGHLVFAAYWQRELTSFEKQVDLGLLGGNVRNTWLHFNCDKPLRTDWAMYPDLHSCIRCKKKLGTSDMVQPVFQIVNPRAVNPNDFTDVGIALNERLYLVHCDCTNTQLDHRSTNILVAP
jgi:hypothetical protein